MKKKTKISFWILGLIIIVLSGAYIYLRNIRDHTFWIIEQKLANGIKIDIKIDNNCRKIWSFPPNTRFPIWTKGGDECRFDLYFSYKNKNYQFKTKELPVLLNIWDNVFYAVIENAIKEDGMGIEYRPEFNFFKYVDGWQSIPAEDFPKQIAIDNLSFSKSFPSVDNPDNINENIDRFKKSTTALLWLYLEKKLTINVLKEDFQVDPKFILDYRKKYIDPFWSGKNLDEYLPILSESDRKRVW